SFGSKGLFRGRRRILQTIPECDRFLPQTGLVSISSETINALMRKGPMVSLGKDYRAEIAHRAICGTNILVCPFWSRPGRKPVLHVYAVNEVPQPQLPVAFGFVKVNPDPITPVT